MSCGGSLVEEVIILKKLVIGNLIISMVVVSGCVVPHTNVNNITDKDGSSSVPSETERMKDDNITLIIKDDYEGAIFTHPYLSTWRPDIELIDQFESSLIQYLHDLSKNNYFDSYTGYTYWDEDITYIINNYKNYKRQYFGIKSDNGENILRVEFVAESLALSWKTVRITPLIFDGGADLFQIEYNIQTNKFIRFNINGVA